MTADEQHAVIGKAYADLKAAKDKLRALNLAAQDLGIQLSQVGNALATKPYTVGLNGEIDMPTNLGSALLFDRKIFDANRFRDLTNEIRDTMVLIQNLEHKLA